ncbi:hypothetical protein BX666DRAFT_67500 [Dichotomocladium elegans]|nr:hypothetical protein BX666DRAFT_67500 [Dichotomocladium elegans]
MGVGINTMSDISVLEEDAQNARVVRCLFSSFRLFSPPFFSPFDIKKDISASSPASENAKSPFSSSAFPFFLSFLSFCFPRMLRASSSIYLQQLWQRPSLQTTSNEANKSSGGAKQSSGDQDDDLTSSSLDFPPPPIPPKRTPWLCDTINIRAPSNKKLSFSLPGLRLLVVLCRHGVLTADSYTALRATHPESVHRYRPKSRAAASRIIKVITQAKESDKKAQARHVLHKAVNVRLREKAEQFGVLIKRKL